MTENIRQALESLLGQQQAQLAWEAAAPSMDARTEPAKSEADYWW